MYYFEVVTEVAADPETLFDVARDMDVHKKSQDQFNEKIVAGVSEGLIGLDESVTFRATHFGVPFRMTSKITEFDRPLRFVDEQQSGPFKRFHHEHVFEATADGTLMHDKITFVAPVGLVGKATTKLFLGRYVETLIRHRGDFIKAEAENKTKDD